MYLYLISQSSFEMTVMFKAVLNARKWTPALVK